MNEPDIPFEIEYNDETGKLQLELIGHNTLTELEKKSLHKHKKKHIVYSYNYNSFVGNEFLLFRFVFTKKNKVTRKEDLYRLFYIYSSNKPKEIQYNYCSFNFSFKSLQI